MSEKKPDFDLSALSLDQDQQVLTETPRQQGRAARKPTKASGSGNDKPQVQERAHVGGRPTFKAPGTECVRMIFVLPLETKQIMNQALAGQFFGKYRSQVELVDAAIRAFVANGGK